ncbi:GH92 family glycosyl hydrolase [Mucilaginibacter sp. BT774]|uniref:GH92 family glycosyl hydrolase n=1 Tax=Mucilaginibacter sp. BT774 TaxID=3062276 RepID=UPI002674AC7F|nr:GH92 family glycosyl hydrolase [Mucilaginibacter sp. BT774]MDO3627615.1 GH92 family glycosyl hydrolase [Mucilaginibacter sp. BT774]
MKKSLTTSFVLILFVKIIVAQSKGPADYVNPFIGASTSAAKAGDASGLGKTFPGAATPFGMVQVNPNTITGGDNGSGYSYENKYIEGFAFTQMTGVGWYGDLGNFLVTPTTGALRVVAGRHPELPGYRSRYRKSDEIAKAGYYAVTLTDYHVRSEMTAAPHSGVLRFTFPKNKESRIQIDLARRIGGTSVEQYVKVVDDHTIQGWMRCTPDGGGWGNGGGDPNYTVYFYAELSKPLKKYGVWSAHIPAGQSRYREDIESLKYDSLIAKADILSGCTEKQGKHLGFYTDFETGSNEVVLLKTGISFSSIEGAKFNLSNEIPGWDFNKTRRQAHALWNKALSKISIQGGTRDQKIVFYTALYHTMIDPRSITDLNGEYPGGDSKIHQTDKFIKRSIFSGWDVFRSQFPLQALINPAVVSDMINSLDDLADRSGKGYLERWEFLNAYSGCMIGNPAVTVIADAYNKGIRTFDLQKAYQFSRNSCEKFGNTPEPHDMDISGTLEFCFDEWCLAQLAVWLHHPEDVNKYLKRSETYKQIFDDSVGWFRPKNKDGVWAPWPKDGRLRQDYGTAESNGYQQGWFVPHDVNGVAILMGGREKAIADLNTLFEHTPTNFQWNNYYNHANEPVHLAPFLFNRLGAPWLTQKWVRRICENAYHNSIEGLVGNEDVGQMSAWYVLAASGIHQECPGDNRYEIFSPIFNKISIHVGTTGKTFTIIAQNNSPQNCYIQSAKLNGKVYNKCYIDYKQIANGDTLELVMGPHPNMKWGQ